MIWLKQATFLTLAAAVIAALFNLLNPGGLAIATFSPFPDLAREAHALNVPQIDLLDARQSFDEGRAVFVDARPPELYAKGRIPGALNLPDKKFEAYFTDFHTLIPPEESVVIYCDGQDCHASIEVAEQLKKKGYQNIRIFTGGWEQWTDSAFPVEWD